jgi:hypothetical protein
LAERVLQLEDLVNHGRYLEARELALKLRNDPTANPLRVDQLLALSTSKSGSPETALAYLELAYRRNPDDPETAGILGGIYKELFKKHQDSKYAILSRDTYAKNFSATQNYYTGINAATMSIIAGRVSQGRAIASQVIALLSKTENDFWELATLGEACLLTKDRTSSIEFYIRARQLSGNDWGKVISVYNQLWLLNHYLPVAKEIMRIFSPPTVVASIGHMIDHPSRQTPRFPAAIENEVRESLVGAIRTMNAGIGYCSLACGSDIMFVEAMEQAGAEVHIFIPFAKDDFIEASVRFAGGEWLERFERLVSRFPVTYITHDRYDGHDDLFAFQCKIIFGSAMLRSIAYHQEPMLLTVQSEMDLKRKAGGTRDTIRLWPLPDRHININPDPFVIGVPIPPPATGTIPSSPLLEEKQTKRLVLYMVMLDLSETSGMEKESIYKSINGRMNEELIPYVAFDIGPETVYMAFETETNAIDFVQETLHVARPMQQERNLKISLHAGPAYLEQVAQNENLVKEGEALTLLRSISQLTPKGRVCASDYFASILALNPKKFKLDYAGILTYPESPRNCGVYSVTFKP